MTWSNVPVCEQCWIEREGVWDPVGPDGTFPAGAKILTGLRQPVRMVNPGPDGEFRLESCHFCEQPTFIGIYQRVET
jgi:hypothetical protein